MEFKDQFFVVKFLHLPREDMDDYAVVPYPWIKSRIGTDLSIVYSYYPVEDPKSTKHRVVQRELYSDTWNLYQVNVEFRTDSYEQAEDVISLLMCGLRRIIMEECALSTLKHKPRSTKENILPKFQIPKLDQKSNHNKKKEDQYYNLASKTPNYSNKLEEYKTNLRKEPQKQLPSNDSKLNEQTFRKIPVHITTSRTPNFTNRIFKTNEQVILDENKASIYNEHHKLLNYPLTYTPNIEVPISVISSRLEAEPIIQNDLSRQCKTATPQATMVRKSNEIQEASLSNYQGVSSKRLPYDPRKDAQIISKKPRTGLEPKAPIHSSRTYSSETQASTCRRHSIENVQNVNRRKSLPTEIHCEQKAVPSKGKNNLLHFVNKPCHLQKQLSVTNQPSQQVIPDTIHTIDNSNEKSYSQDTNAKSVYQLTLLGTYRDKSQKDPRIRQSINNESPGERCNKQDVLLRVVTSYETFQAKENSRLETELIDKKKLVLYGLGEHSDETEEQLRDRTIYVINKILNEKLDRHIEGVTRLEKNGSRCRSIVVEIQSMNIHDYILSKKELFNSNGLGVTDFLSLMSGNGNYIMKK